MSNLEFIAVNPKSLTFYEPYNRYQRRILTLLNPNSERLIFKMKTNAQAYYCVSPILGILEPYSTQEIQINLNFFPYDEQRFYNHRFSLQAVKAPNELSQDLERHFKVLPSCFIDIIRIPVALSEYGIQLSDPVLPNQQQGGCRNMSMQTEKPLAVRLQRSLLNLETPTAPRQSKSKLLILFKAALTLLIPGAAIATAYFQRERIMELLNIDTQFTYNALPEKFTHIANPAR